MLLFDVSQNYIFDVWNHSKRDFRELHIHIRIIYSSSIKLCLKLYSFLVTVTLSRHTINRDGRTRVPEVCPCPSSWFSDMPMSEVVFLSVHLILIMRRRHYEFQKLSRSKIIYAIEIYSTCTSIINSHWAIRILIMLNHKLSNQALSITFSLNYRDNAIRSWFSSYSGVFLEHISITSHI